MAERPDPDTDPAVLDVLADWWFAADYCNQPEPFKVRVSESIVDALREGGYDVVPRDTPDTPATDPNTLADRLDNVAQHGIDYDHPESEDPFGDMCRAAAVGLRQLADENRALREAILDAATELGLTHEPDWASDKAKADGKDPVWCRICGPADGSWPCTSQMVVTDLLAAADRGVTDGDRNEGDER